MPCRRASTTPSRILRSLSTVAALWLFAPVADAAPSVVVTEHARVELLAQAPTGAAPGQPLTLGLHFQHQPEWHTYWRNPGDSGLPITLDWKLPAGVVADAIQWPTPTQLPLGPLMNYGFDSDVLLPVAVTLPAGFSGDLEVVLHAEWLICKIDCIPESGDFSLRVSASAPSTTHAALFAAAAARIPQPLADASISARVDGEHIAVEVGSLPAAYRDRSLKFFAESAGVIDHAAAIEQQFQGDVWHARIPLSTMRSDSPTEMFAVLTGADDAAGVRVRLPLQWTASTPTAVGDDAPPPVAPAVAPAGFGVALLLALFGGALLNLMPCVFPVLSLKVFDFATPGQDQRARVLGGLAFSVGVIVSFVALAALLIALRAGGEQFGWGFQLQSPGFVALLALLFTLIGLNFAGVFEFGNVLPSRIATLRARNPLLDHALSGALAVAVASPCTGPFMGAALGAALTMPVAQALLVFAVLGLGMALPFLLLSLIPALVRWMPRPGIWMLRLKTVMAFPMFATVVWLLWVFGQQVGIDGAAALMAVLVAVAFLAWAIGAADFSHRERVGFTSTALLALIATSAWAVPLVSRESKVASGTAAHERWQPWSPSAQATALAGGQAVFVDFTAAWCITCQYNKRTALVDADVLGDFERLRIVTLRADWTRRDAEITRELTRLGRSGVPVYAFHLPSAEAPVLLSEILRVAELRRVLAQAPSTSSTDP